MSAVPLGHAHRHFYVQGKCPREMAAKYSKNRQLGCSQAGERVTGIGYHLYVSLFVEMLSKQTDDKMLCHYDGNISLA